MNYMNINDSNYFQYFTLGNSRMIKIYCISKRFKRHQSLKLRAFEIQCIFSQGQFFLKSIWKSGLHFKTYMEFYKCWIRHATYSCRTVALREKIRKTQRATGPFLQKPFDFRRNFFCVRLYLQSLSWCPLTSNQKS